MRGKFENIAIQKFVPKCFSSIIHNNLKVE